MNRWNTWVAWLATAGLCLSLALAACPAEPPPAESKPDKTAGAPPAAEVPRQEVVVPPAGAPAAGAPKEKALEFLQAAAANRGPQKSFRTPQMGAACFLYAVQKKDLNLISTTIALHAATESRNQELFRLILAQKLGQEDLDELAQKLFGFQVAGSNGSQKGGGIMQLVLTRHVGNGVMRRTLTMRHEKAGWKVQDISGEGEPDQPIITPHIAPPPKPAEKPVQP